MPLAWVWALGLVALAPASPGDSAFSWSPDGEWLAYTVRTQARSESLPRRWLFEPGRLADESGAGWRPVNTAGTGETYRLWATHVESRESVLLASGSGPLSAPSWGPDGKALAFARIVPEAGGRARYEVLVQDEPDRQRVLLSRPVTDRHERAADLCMDAPAWSPDGRLLAVPWPQQTRDLAVVRADNGRILKVLHDAERPAWSPDTRNIALAFVHGHQQPALQWVDGAFGAPRTLIELGQSTHTPVWLEAGSLAVVVSTPGRKAGAPPSEQYSLVRVATDTGAVQLVVSLSANPGEFRGPPRSTSFAFDRERENLFFTRAAAGPPYEIVWSRPRHNEILKPFAPFDFTIPSSALAISPHNRFLAFRCGGTGGEALPAFVDLEDERLSPVALVPDDDVRSQWILTLVRAARRLLFVALPPAKAGDGRELERPTVLPLAGEIPPQQELLARLRQLGRSGRPICDRPAGTSPTDPAVREFIGEARLFFDYLRQDFDAALTSLDALEAQLSDADARLRLLSVRAQIYVAQGRGDLARETIGYLRACGAREARSVEDTPLGPELTSAPTGRQEWPKYLLERTEAYLKVFQTPAGDEENAHNPFGNLNPDAPEAGGFGGPFLPRRPRVFPFVPQGPAQRGDGGADLVLPPGGIVVPPAPPQLRRPQRR